MCFTVQLSKIGFALPFVSNSFAIISCRFLPVKNFFQLFWSCFCFSLAATLISYHIQPAVVKNFFISFLQLFVRRNSFMLSRVFSDVKNFFHFFTQTFHILHQSLELIKRLHTNSFACRLHVQIPLQFVIKLPDADNCSINIPHHLLLLPAVYPVHRSAPTPWQTAPHSH